MATYAHPVTPPIPNRKRCKTLHSPKIPARCRLTRGHDGEHRFGNWSNGTHLFCNLDLPMPEPIGRKAAEPEDARP